MDRIRIFKKLLEEDYKLEVKTSEMDNLSECIGIIGEELGLEKFYATCSDRLKMKLSSKDEILSYMEKDKLSRIEKDRIKLNDEIFLTYDFTKESDEWSSKLLYCRLDVFEEILKIRNDNLHISEENLISILDEIIDEAIEKRASDIHLEQEERYGKIRFRIDGILSKYYRYNLDGYNKLNTRIKVLSSLDISNKLLPQDGHIKWEYSEESYDIRVSTMPTIYGEKIVMRILYKDDNRFSLDRLNILDESLECIKSIIKNDTGMVLIVGPTGSGKTTTLYSMLKYLEKDRYNIVTIEDPVEYRIDGVNQTQINRKAGLDFSSGLRAILRQDPDIILVGEIRDRETARLSLRSSITGHLVLSTLHTSTIGGSILRLKDLDVDKYLILDGIKLIINQRLIRKLCDNCKMEDEIDEKLREKYKINGRVYKPVGCSKCNDGYLDRIGIYEVLKVDRNILDHIEEYSDGLLEKDLVKKLGLGLTSMEEFLKIVN